MTDTEEYTNDMRQADVQAMLLALLLIERGDIEAAKRVLMERLPVNTGRVLLKAKP